MLKGLDRREVMIIGNIENVNRLTNDNSPIQIKTVKTCPKKEYKCAHDIIHIAIKSLK